MNNSVDPISDTPQTRLSEAWRILGKLGHIDTIFNHISTASCDMDGVLQVTMNPDGYFPSEVPAERMITFPIQAVGTIDAERLGVNRDGFELHSTVHRARMVPGTVLHTHSPYALAVGATSHGLLPVSQTAMEFVRDAIYIEYDGLFRNLGKNRAFTEFSARGGIAFLRNHGTLIVAKHIEDAVYMQHFLEEACKTQVIALSQNQELLVPLDEVVKNASNTLIQDRHSEAIKLFGAFKRTLLR